MRAYRCPKCNNYTLEYDEHTRVLSCSHIDFVIMKSCDFRIPMPEQVTLPNDSQILVVLEKYRQGRKK